MNNLIMNIDEDSQITQSIHDDIIAIHVQCIQE